MPTCVKGKSTLFLTLKYKLKNKWTELPPFAFSFSWDTCKNACPKNKKFQKGNCLSAKYAKPERKVEGVFKYMGFKIDYQLIIEEAVDETICEYKCVSSSKLKKTYGKPLKNIKQSRRRKN